MIATVPDQSEETLPCRICGRKFVSERLTKHETACQKMTKSKRKVFDSGKQRATGSDITMNDIRRVRKEKEKIGGIYPRPRTGWREKHETLVNAVTASRQVDYALKTGTPLPPPPMSSLAKELIRCQYCGRNFNETAAERHIPHCHEQSLRKARGTSTTRSTSNQRRTQKSKSPSGRNQGRAEEEKGLISKTADLFINDSLRSFPSNKTSHEKLSGQHHLNQSNRSTPPIHRTMANDTETVTKISRTSAVRKRSTSIPKKAKAQHHKG